MSPDLEMHMGLGSSPGMGYTIDPFPPSAPFLANGAPNAACLYGIPTPEAMRVEELLDLSGQQAFFDTAPPQPDQQHYHHGHQYFPHHDPPSAAAATAATAAAASDLTAFPFDLYIPGEEEAAELEWLSSFVEDSFSPFAMQGMGNGPPVAAGGGPHLHYNMETHNYQMIEQQQIGVPARARTKRSRVPTAAAWAALASTSPSSSSSSSTETRPRGARKEKDAGGGGGTRKCTHCASEKTPQWRTGPLGPKTLCNACGVRFKSGRLVPEYRPAASPTFVLTQHSNSHRKVLELRRQKELLMRHPQPPFVSTPGSASSSSPAAARPDMLLRDYEVC